MASSSVESSFAQGDGRGQLFSVSISQLDLEANPTHHWQNHSKCIHRCINESHTFRGVIVKADGCEMLNGKNTESVFAGFQSAVCHMVCATVSSGDFELGKSLSRAHFSTMRLHLATKFFEWGDQAYQTTGLKFKSALPPPLLCLPFQRQQPPDRQSSIVCDLIKWHHAHRELSSCE